MIAFPALEIPKPYFLSYQASFMHDPRYNSPLYLPMMNAMTLLLDQNAPYSVFQVFAI
jgi:hypothetical protein